METRIPQLTELVRAARRAGAHGSEFLFEEFVGHRLGTQRGQVSAREQLRGERLQVRVWLEGGREGSVEGPLDSGAALIDQALLQAADAGESALHGPMGRLSAVLGGLGIDDRRYGAIEHEDRLDVLTTAERAVRAVDRRLVPGAGFYEDRRTLRTFANSKGVELEERNTTYRAGTSASIVGESHVIRSSVEARTFASIASIPFGTNAGTIAVAVLPRGEQLEGPVRVLLEPEATAALIAALGEGFTAARLRSGNFFLKPAPDGSPVVDERLHLIDDGTVHGALRTASFDDRGIAPVPLTLLREGRVDGRFIGVDTARLTDTRPTGHDVDGALLPRNLALRSGGRSVNVLLNEAQGPVLVVHQLPDLSGLDLVSGAFEAPVVGSVWRDNAAVGGMSSGVLRGDLMTVLNSVVEVASNTDRIGHVDAPAILLDGFTIGA